MTSPHAVKFALEQCLHELARDGPPLTITGLHSVVVDGRTVHAGFDVEPGNDVLYFEFEMLTPVSREHLCCFCQWLGSLQEDPDRTMH